MNKYSRTEEGFYSAYSDAAYLANTHGKSFWIAVHPDDTEFYFICSYKPSEKHILCGTEPLEVTTNEN